MTITTQNNPISALLGSPSTAHLPQWGLILISGVDAKGFLQNQLTNSVLDLTGTQSGQIAQSHGSVRLVGYCSPKGRLMASAWLGLYQQAAEDVYALFISKDIAASFAKRLSMFILRSKVSIKEVSSEWTILGLHKEEQADSSEAVQDGELALQLPSVLVNGKPIARILLATKNPPNKNNLDSDSFAQWNYLEVLSAIPRIVAATQEQFVPQMINFESVAGVDFKKGCYPGQEIVARSQYRGVIKRRLQLAHIDCKSGDLDTSLPGVELYHEADGSQPAGMVVLSAPNPNVPSRVDLQIECKLEALEQGEIHLGSIEGPVLKIDTLPYPLIEI